jgi:tRNA (cytidine/uridine-2'-O-)-methyltransferase
MSNNSQKNFFHLALYQPDIPQNVGAAMRLAACLGIRLDIIEPCGFPWKPVEFKRSGMDYVNLVDLHKHSSWEKFQATYPGQRRILLTTKTTTPYFDFAFKEGDILLMGRESAGVPEDVHENVDVRLTIPMHGIARSMNVINAASIVCGEALRQYLKKQ